MLCDQCLDREGVSAEMGNLLQLSSPTVTVLGTMTSEGSLKEEEKLFDLFSSYFFTAAQEKRCVACVYVSSMQTKGLDI